MAKPNLEFRKIKSLGFLYEIREDGRIFRNVKSKRQIKIKLEMHHSPKGYYAAFIHYKGRTQRCPIHKMVAEAWLGDMPEGLEIDHIDRNTHNNHYSNLRYVTHSEQMKNRVMSERMKNIIRTNCLNYTLTQVAKPVATIRDGIRKEYRSMMKCAEALGEEYGVDSESIRSKLKKHRKHIYDYDIDYLNAET